MVYKEATVEVPKLNVPAELLAEVSRRNHAHKTDFRVDAFSKPSLLERIARMLGLG